MNNKVEDSFPRKSERSDFWWNVKALLERPYDQKEYIALWKAVKSRKPTLKDMDLRNGKFYSTRRLGKSYLDHYKGELNILNILCNDDMVCLTFQSGATPPCLVPMVHFNQCLVHRHSDFLEHLQICLSNDYNQLLNSVPPDVYTLLCYFSFR